MISPIVRLVQEIRLRQAGLAEPLFEALDGERRARTALAALQAEKLKKLVAHASATVPFWRLRFQAMGLDPFSVRSIADLTGLVPLDKEDLRTRGKELLTSGNVDPRWIRNASGGSTGTPVEFYQDLAYHRRMLADQMRHVTWTGLPWWTPRAYVWGADRDSRAHEGVWGRMKDGLLGVSFLNSFRAADDDYRRFARQCAARRTPLLIGYASALDHFARVLEDAPGTWRPKAIQSSAERLTPAMRERIERVFEAPVFDRYGSREMGNAAHECSAHKGLHVSMERVIVEIVRGRHAVPDGAEGEIVVTVLDNFAQPLLRYRTGDVGRKLTATPCPCGRAGEKIEITAGRTSDLFSAPSGRRVHGEYFTHLFYGKNGVAAFRVIQETKERIVLEIVKASDWRDGELDSVLAGIREIDSGFRPEIRFVDTIPSPESGKRRFTLSHVPVEWTS